MVRGLNMSTLIDGQKLRKLRQGRGWDQKTLAKQANVDPSIISRLERGLQENITVSVLIGLAKSLGVPVDALLVPYRETKQGELTYELSLAVGELPSLSAEHQRLVAAILQGCMSALSNEIKRIHKV